jgi:uncharacterized protein DUF3175
MANRTGRSSNKRGRSKSKRWSTRVTKHSNALDLEPRVFRSHDPRKIACSLKRSAERSKRRKGTPYQSAMSMLNFYINRAGKNLPQTRKRILERAKGQLRDAFWPQMKTGPQRRTRVSISLGQRQAAVFLWSWCS